MASHIAATITGEIKDSGTRYIPEILTGKTQTFLLHP
jgi:hypothetical protein